MFLDGCVTDYVATNRNWNAVDSSWLLCYGSTCHNWIAEASAAAGEVVYEEDVTCELLVLVLEHYALTCYVILSCQYGLCGSVDACSLIILVLIPPQCDLSLVDFCILLATAAPVDGIRSGFGWGSGALALWPCVRLPCLAFWSLLNLVRDAVEADGPGMPHYMVEATRLESDWLHCVALDCFPYAAWDDADFCTKKLLWGFCPLLMNPGSFHIVEGN
ncbi:hypothetical protein Nepgr_020435 [Nepenthes gracilis]|uniref:Uncharacterized protein n=1 Tax=Nepenthes gracilis TaxID=150966 RepID=A0AAD3SWZ1_NEPGR|nr:hypothetical protein Nepgr_020435 [Nepenthes gracilis]